MSKKELTAKEVDEKFDAGEELSDFFTEELDPDTYQPKAKKKIQKQKISADLPVNILNAIDSIGEKTGNTRNSVIRMLLAKALKKILDEDK